MNVRYDKEADAIYIKLTERRYSHGKDLDNERRIDYDAEGNPRGIELLCVSTGVLIDDLPEEIKIKQILKSKGIRIYKKDDDPKVKQKINRNLPALPIS